MPQEPETTEVLPAELLATVGHELRGPLTTIQGYATTLLHHEQHLTQEERQEFLRAISDASTHLSKLVERFLELAQLEAGVHPLLAQPLDALSLAREAILAAQSSRLVLVPAPADQHHQQFPGPPQDCTLAGDRRLLRLMLDLLVENALMYSAPESPVELSLASISPEEARAAAQAPARVGAHRALIVTASFPEQEPLLALSVRDHGMGISPEHLALIFHRFYRVDTRLTRESNGLGLGLALCKAIVALHQGMLWVESAVGEGSTFVLVFPRGQIHAEDEPGRQVEETPSQRMEEHL